MEHTIFGLIKKRGQIAERSKVALKASDTFKTDLNAIDRALVLCGYEGDAKAIAPRGKYKQLFGRSELKLTRLNVLREAPADDEAIAAHLMDARVWDSNLNHDVLKRVRDIIQRAQRDGHLVQNFGPNGRLWRLK